MNALFHKKGAPESLGAFVLRTNSLARDHILGVRIRARCAGVVAYSRKSAPLENHTSASNIDQGSLSEPITLPEMKIFKEYWDVLGVDGNEVILRRKLLNGVNEEFVLDLDEMEEKGLAGVRAGRRIEVWKDPETGNIRYELQRYTKLATTPLLRSILDAEEASKQAEGVLQGGQNIAHSDEKTDDVISEKPNEEKTITVTVIGNDGKEEIVVVSRNSGDLWVCVDDAIESVPDDFLIRSDFGGPEMLVNKKKLTNRLKNANIQKGDIILIRGLPNNELRYDLVVSYHLDEQLLKDLGTTEEELKKYINS